jgi:hypothetical protein
MSKIYTLLAALLLAVMLALPGTASAGERRADGISKADQMHEFSAHRRHYRYVRHYGPRYRHVRHYYGPRYRYGYYGYPYYRSYYRPAYWGPGFYAGPFGFGLGLGFGPRYWW